MAQDNLEQHQRQCDSRYVGWSWLVGILTILVLAAAGYGWSAARTLGDVERSSERIADSLRVVKERFARADSTQRRDILDMQTKTAVLDTLRFWLPKADAKLNEIRDLVRR